MGGSVVAELHRFEVRLPEDLFQQVARAAESHQRSINGEILRAAQAWVELYEAQGRRGSAQRTPGMLGEAVAEYVAQEERSVWLGISTDDDLVRLSGAAVR